MRGVPYNDMSSLSCSFLSFSLPIEFGFVSAPAPPQFIRCVRSPPPSLTSEFWLSLSRSGPTRSSSTSSDVKWFKGVFFPLGALLRVLSPLSCPRRRPRQRSAQTQMGGIASFPGVHEPAHLPPTLRAMATCVHLCVGASSLWLSLFQEGGEAGCKWVCLGVWGAGRDRLYSKGAGTSVSFRMCDRRGEGWARKSCCGANEAEMRATHQMPCYLAI